MEARIRSITLRLAPLLRLPSNPTQGSRFNVDILRALADIESQGGLFNLPRNEEHWYKRLSDPAHMRHRDFTARLKRDGRQVTASWSPWQLLAFNAMDMGWPDGLPIPLLSEPEIALPFVIEFINHLSLSCLHNLNGGIKRLQSVEPSDVVQGWRKSSLQDVGSIDNNQTDTLLAILGDGYNTGNSGDGIYPVAYVTKFQAAYHHRASAGL